MNQLYLIMKYSLYFIYHNNSIGEAPQDMKYNGEKTFTIIGENVTIRESVTINRGTTALGQTVVGDNVFESKEDNFENCLIVSDCKLFVYNFF